MEWIKKGLIYASDGEYEWNQSHAQVPVVDKVNENVWRIYYSARDSHNKSNISYIEVESADPKRIIYKHTSPILNFGRLGTFDDSGIMPAWVINFNGKIYLYYIGWTTKGTVPYQNSIGLAISDNGGRDFYKYSEGPIIGQSVSDPYFTGTICVLLDDGIWKAWYLSCTKWEIINNKAESFYNIKYAESTDGINWKREGKVAVDLKDTKEGGIASASVIKEDNKYKMWYSYRGKEGFRQDNSQSYKIGYAESDNGIDWERKDSLAGIELSSSGWDSQMIAYPHVIKNNSRKIMFYNGNGFGRSGFGYAILNDE